MKPVIEYEGAVYVRPLGRGIVFEDLPDKPYLDDLLPGRLDGYRMGDGWSGRLRIVIEVEDEVDAAEG